MADRTSCLLAQAIILAILDNEEYLTYEATVSNVEKLKIKSG